MIVPSTHLLTFGGIGTVGGLFTGWLGNLARSADKDKIRAHEKELLIYASHSNQRDYMLRNKSSSFKDVEFARDKGNMFAFGRRFIVVVIFSVFALLPLLAILHIPFGILNTQYHNLLGLIEWQTTKISYLKGMPLPSEFWDIIIYAMTFYFGKSAYR